MWVIFRIYSQHKSLEISLFLGYWLISEGFNLVLNVIKFFVGNTGIQGFYTAVHFPFETLLRSAL